MLIVEKLFLLFTRDNGYINVRIPHQDKALAAGLLSDLVLAGFVDVGDSGDALNSSIYTLDPAPVVNIDSELIVAGYWLLKEHPGTSVSKLLRAPWFAKKEDIARSLTDQGVVTIDNDKFLGVTWEKFPTIDGQPEANVRERLARILEGKTEATAQEALTLIILSEVGNIKMELRKDLEGVTSREINERINELWVKHITSPSESAIKGVRHAVKSMVSVLSSSAFFMS